MDRGQTFDVVDTPPPNRQEWPSFEDFSRDEIKKYRDIDTGCYKLLESFDQGQNKYGGPSVVLKLEHRNGAILQVWAPSSLVHSLRRKGKTQYIWNYGLVKCEKTGNYFFDFSLY